MNDKIVVQVHTQIQLMSFRGVKLKVKDIQRVRQNQTTVFDQGLGICGSMSKKSPIKRSVSGLIPTCLAKINKSRKNNYMIRERQANHFIISAYDIMKNVIEIRLRECKIFYNGY